MAKTIKLIKLYKVDLFSISTNLCQRTTMINTDVPNCYVFMPKIIIIGENST